MKNFKSIQEKSKNLFFSKNEPWWLIGFSMLLASGIFIEPLLICTSLINGKLSDMWLYWSATIGSAFSISFFAHLWKNVPINTENEFIFFRFSGIGAKFLHIFRSIYLGGFIIPFIIAFNILAFSKITCLIFQIKISEAIVLISVLLIILSLFNSFKNRIRIDFVLFIVFIVSFLIVFIAIFLNVDGLDNVAVILKTKEQLQILPSISSTTINAFLIFILVQWWSATILDYPDMNGQKLMASKSIKDISKSVFFPSFLMIFFRILFFTLPFIAVYFDFTNGFTDGELAFTSLFINTLPKWMLIFVILLFFIPFLSIVQNTQNWGGSLLIENFYKKYIDLKSANNFYIGILAMIFIIVVSCAIALFSESLIEMSKLLFSMTAGVGPVFILRWYWWRINAWSQLSAMISGLICPNIYDWLFSNNVFFNQFIKTVSYKYNIDYYPIKLVFLTIIVCAIWISVTFLTAQTDEKVLKTFVATIKPGGFWKKYENNGKIFCCLRILGWLLQTIKGFLIYFVFWNFLIGEYFNFILLLLLVILLFSISYHFINKANQNYDSTINIKTNK